MSTVRGQGQGQIEHLRTLGELRARTSLRQFRLTRGWIDDYHLDLGRRPGQPLGVVQLVQGLAEHARRYGRLATALNAAGFLITGADTRGARRVGFNGGAAGQLWRRRSGRLPG